MKASIYTKYGPPDVLQIKEVEKPIPGNGDLLVKVFAATVNRTDCAMLRAKPFIMRFFTGLFVPKKQILGTDFAGQIEALGKGVSSFKVGDRVFGFDDSGLCSHGEYLVISEKSAIDRIPDGVSYKEAAASIEGAHYAYNFVNKFKLIQGKRILINGSTGAIGIAALQLCKYYGAYVTAVCNTKNIELIKSLGADEIIDYLNEDFTRRDGQYDYVFDAVGKSSLGKCRSLLKKGGVYVSSELGWMAQNVFFAIFKFLTGDKKVVFPIPIDKKASVMLVKKLLNEGHFKSIIDREYPLERVSDAFAFVLTGQKTGNVILNIAES